MDCNCNKNAFTFLDMKTGIRVYICSETSTNVNFKTKEITEKERNLPCNFRKEVQEFEPYIKPYIEPKPEKPSKLITKPETDLEKLQRLVKGFLKEKKYTLFQEIEILCRSLNIPTKQNEESIYEFTQRLLK